MGEIAQESRGRDGAIGDYCEVVQVNDSFFLVPVEGRTSALGFGHVQFDRRQGTLSCHVAKGRAISNYTKREGKGSKHCSHTLLALWALQGAGTRISSQVDPKRGQPWSGGAGRAQRSRTGDSLSNSPSRSATSPPASPPFPL